MARYHVNAKGEAKLCRAVKGQCPFGSSEAHFASREEAQQAYEHAQGGSFAVASSTTPAHLRQFTDDDRKRFVKQARELIDLLSTDGNFELPDEMQEEWEVDDEGEEFLSKATVRLGDFRLLASGAGVNAYLHEPTATVYKVPHFGSVGDFWSEDTSETLVDLAKNEKKAYERLDHGKLATENLTYTPTRYFGLNTSKGPVPIIAQTYLDPEEYEPHYLTGTEQNRLAGMGVWDLNMGNVRLHKPTGRLVLLDCIPAWD